MFDLEKIVYCRYGKDYIPAITKQAQLAANNPVLSTPGRSIATYLINIKKLVQDHNIDSEDKNFAKLKTKGSIKRIEITPGQYYVLESSTDPTLVFESRFESGNLLAALKVSDQEYDLVLQNDINTHGHTQWFFFRVGNTKKGSKIRFNIINLAKPDSLYNSGMKVASYSQNLRKTEDLGWHRVGSEIKYYQNSF